MKGCLDDPQSLMKLECIRRYFSQRAFSFALLITAESFSRLYGVLGARVNIVVLYRRHLGWKIHLHEMDNHGGTPYEQNYLWWPVLRHAWESLTYQLRIKIAVKKNLPIPSKLNFQAEMRMIKRWAMRLSSEVEVLHLRNPTFEDW